MDDVLKDLDFELDERPCSRCQKPVIWPRELEDGVEVIHARCVQNGDVIGGSARHMVIKDPEQPILRKVS